MYNELYKEIGKVMTQDFLKDLENIYLKYNIGQGSGPIINMHFRKMFESKSINYHRMGLKPAEILYRAKNNDWGRHYCLICNCEIDKFNIVKKEFRKFCSSKCAQQHISTTEKRKTTNLERYGDENYNNRPKVKITKLQCYGDENYNNPKKAKQTNILKYGVEHPNQLPDHLQKTIDTNIKKYGVDYMLRVSNLGKKTKFKRYGNENYFNKEKYESTMLRKYGVKYSAQSPELLEKILTTKSHKITLPSGNIVNVQGYEPEAIQILFSLGYKEDNLLLKNRPTIKYFWESKERLYHPDIILIKEKRIIEVKSEYWFNKELEKNLAKQRGAIKSGWDHIFMIFNNKKTLLTSDASKQLKAR